MVVTKYIPDRLYGFVGDLETSQQAFFHLGVFDPKHLWVPHKHCSRCPRGGCSWSQTAPPPILGELVEVSGALGSGSPGQAPRASRVERLSTPIAVRGKVETFDSQRGYGFIAGEDGLVYHLHQSEMTEKRIPLSNQAVIFYAGTREKKPRACHVRICWDQAP